MYSPGRTPTPRNRVFLQKEAFAPTDSLKNPVSRPPCVSPNVVESPPPPKSREAKLSRRESPPHSHHPYFATCLKLPDRLSFLIDSIPNLAYDLRINTKETGFFTSVKASNPVFS